MALALNVHASPGVYALLLGSGISIASGVKTGWGVVEGLVGKVAAVRDPGNADARAEAMADPEKWWESNCDEALGYSALLGAVAPKPASRQALLAQYFEPEDGDDDGGEAPTAAHRAIAQLVQRGSIRVILTTNFDRLMEQALQEAGISPQVVHRPEAIDAMKPLAHSQVTAGGSRWPREPPLSAGQRSRPRGGCSRNLQVVNRPIPVTLTVESAVAPPIAYTSKDSAVRPKRAARSSSRPRTGPRSSNSFSSMPRSAAARRSGARGTGILANKLEGTAYNAEHQWVTGEHRAFSHVRECSTQRPDARPSMTATHTRGNYWTLRSTVRPSRRKRRTKQS